MDIYYDEVKLKLKEPFKSNKGETRYAHQIIVRLIWKEKVGHGTAVLGKEYGMTLETVMESIEKCSQLIKKASPFEIDKFLNLLESTIPNQPTVIAAIDMALHDLIGQITGLPLYHLWGLKGLTAPPTSVSIGAIEKDEMIEKARHLSQWPILKLKLKAKSDVEMVGILRQVYQGRIWIDGNGAWDPEEAVAVANKLYTYGVELLEQPIPAGYPELLRYVHNRSPIPIVADEDFLGLDDVLKLKGCVDVVNIKLLKCGGLRRAREIIELARQVGLRVLLGCKTESVLGITAIAQLAGLADYLDLDGHLNIVSDLYEGVVVNYGELILPTGTGLGITLLESKEA